MHSKRSVQLILIVLVCCPSWAAPADTAKVDATGEHWISTWGVSQLMMPMVFHAPARPPNQPDTTKLPAPPNSPSEAHNPPPRQGPLAEAKLPATFDDETVRMIGRASVGGKRLRIELSNMVTAEPVVIGAVHIALHKADGAIVEGSDRPLTFGGAASFTIPPGALVISNPVDLELPALGQFAVSVYLPHNTGAPTNHFLGLHTAYIAKGDATGATAMPNPSTMFAYVWLSAVDVLAPSDSFTVVAFGDSITEGYATSRDADRSWPAVLARRLQANKATQRVAVVNEGISGNQVLRDGAGQSALARLDRDVLVVPGVKWVILLEGINDINLRGRFEGPDAVTAADLIWGYQQIIERCHLRNLKIIGATITPEEGVPTASERGEAIRQTVNRWIREPGHFDAVIDFDAVMRDSQRPIRLNSKYDPGDHIHPNDTGNQAMADAVDLSWFKSDTQPDKKQSGN